MMDEQPAYDWKRFRTELGYQGLVTLGAGVVGYILSFFFALLQQRYFPLQQPDPLEIAWLAQFSLFFYVLFGISEVVYYRRRYRQQYDFFQGIDFIVPAIFFLLLVLEILLFFLVFTLQIDPIPTKYS